MDPIASLFIFFSILISFLIPNKSSATSFGPIKLVDQVQNIQYMVHGRIVGNGAAAKERTLQVPFTYWKLNVIDQPYGGGLSGEIDIRQPGGEVGEMGYHVGGTANFRDGEEVYVALRDTDEGNVKEVVGLASGKYTVEGNTVRSGLGPTILGANGKPLSPDEFGQIVRRTASGRETEEDKNVFVNRAPTYGTEDEHQHPGAAGVLDPRHAAGDASHAPKEAPASSSETVTKTVKTDAVPPEKPSTGTSGWWWTVAAGLGALAVAAVMLRKR